MYEKREITGMPGMTVLSGINAVPEMHGNQV